MSHTIRSDVTATSQQRRSVFETSFLWSATLRKRKHLAEDVAHVRPALSAVSQPAAISTSAVDSFTLRSVDPQSIAPLNIRTSAPT